MKRIVFQLNAPNDTNGNPRNLMVIISPGPNGHMVTEAYPREHSERGNIIHPHLTVKVPAGEYTRLRKALPMLPESIADTL